MDQNQLPWQAGVMNGPRWWHIFFTATMIVVASLAAFTYSPGVPQRTTALAVIVLLTIAYVVLGRTALDTGRQANLFSVILIVGAGIEVACAPNTAVIQAIVFPLLWSVTRSTRMSIIMNIALAVSVGIGFIVCLGTSPENIGSTIVIEAISLIGSLALGVWISRLAELSAERQRLLEELTAAQQRLGALSRESGVTSERERLAREIHDTIAQSLTGVVMLAQRAQRELLAGHVELVGNQLGFLEESARDALMETRALVSTSASVDLGSGIQPALDRLAVRFERETGTTVDLTMAVEAELDRGTEVVLLRCAQEALANVRKHSGASRVRLDLVAAAIVTLTVSDDGSGFDAGEFDATGVNGQATGAVCSDSGFGLSGMRDRLALVDGVLTVASSTAGTTLTIALPPATASVHSGEGMNGARA